MDLFSLALRVTDQGTDTAVRALNRVEREGKQASSSLTRVAGSLKGLWAALATGAAVVAIGRMVTAAGEGEKSVALLQGAIENAGGTMDEWGERMEAMAVKLQATTRFGDEETREALSTLITISGNVAAGYENIGLVADLAAKKQLTLVTAADVVGKVLAGNTASLSRYGIVVKQGENAMELLRQKFGGFAEREGKTVLGRIAMIRNAWGDLIEELGAVLLGTQGVGDGMGSLVVILQEAIKWVKANSKDLQYLTRIVWEAAKIIGRILVAAVNVLVISFKGWHAMIIAIVAGAKQLPHVFRLALGEATSAIGGFVARAASLVDSIFGTDWEDRANKAITNVGTDLASSSRAVIDKIQTDAEAAIAEVMRTGRAANNAVLAVGGGYDPATNDGTGTGTSTTRRPIAFDPSRTPILAARMEEEGQRQWEAEQAGKVVKVPMVVLPEVQLDSPLWAEQLAGLLDEMQSHFDNFGLNIGNLLGETIGAAFEGGWENAGNVALRGLGTILGQMGKSLLTTGLAMQGLLPSLANPFTSGPAMIAAGTLLTALGAALGSALTGGGGRGSVSTGAAGRVTRTQDDLVRVTIPGTGIAAASAVQARPIQHFTLIGTKDPSVIRDIAAITNNGAARRIRIGGRR